MVDYPNDLTMLGKLLTIGNFKKNTLGPNLVKKLFETCEENHRITQCQNCQNSGSAQFRTILDF